MNFRLRRAKRNNQMPLNNQFEYWEPHIDPEGGIKIFFFSLTRGSLAPYDWSGMELFILYTRINGYLTSNVNRHIWVTGSRHPTNPHIRCNCVYLLSRK